MEFVRKGGNLYSEGWNHWLSLGGFVLPKPTVKLENHHPGGGMMEIEVPIGAIEPLSLSFNLKSAHPGELGSMGMSLSQSRLFTVYELLQDERTGVKRERIVTMKGISAENTPDEMAGRGIKGYGHVIKAITEYEDVIEGYGIVARFNFWTNTWSGYGIDAGSDLDNRILRIAGGASA